MVNTLKLLRKHLIERINSLRSSEHASIYESEILCCTLLLDLVEGELFRNGWHESEEEF